jgi:hypothetical protein
VARPPGANGAPDEAEALGRISARAGSAQTALSRLRHMKKVVPDERRGAAQGELAQADLATMRPVRAEAPPGGVVEAPATRIAPPMPSPRPATINNNGAADAMNTPSDPTTTFVRKNQEAPVSLSNYILQGAVWLAVLLALFWMAGLRF